MFIMKTETVATTTSALASRNVEHARGSIEIAIFVFDYIGRAFSVIHFTFLYLYSFWLRNLRTFVARASLGSLECVSNFDFKF